MARQRRADDRSAYDKALGLLARREHSARELKAKLAARGSNAGEAKAAVERLQDQQYQSDDRFAGSLARQRSGQGYGPRRIAAELKSHGVADAEIRAAIDGLDVDWPALATAQLRRRHGNAPVDTHEERARRAAFLLRRGFDAATVRAATRADLSDSGDNSDV
ncbi:MAG: regulatory protein RecX [Xanthomonadales bacterium]|nr:regulatory protein RecX [Xanthomonadales bacterium]